MKELKGGITIFDRTVIGKVFVKKNNVSKSTIQMSLKSESEIEEEFKKFEKSVEKSIKEIDILINDSGNEECDEILETHKFLLSDPEISTRIWRGLNDLFCNIEYIIKKVYQESIEQFKNMDDPYFKERAKDIEEVYFLIIKNLYEKEEVKNEDISRLIFVGEDISTYELISMKDNISGIILKYGGKTSHIAILCHSFGIPSIFGIENVEEIENGSNVIIDSKQASVIINPDYTTISKYEGLIEKEEIKIKLENETLQLEPITTDGQKIDIKLNVELLAETDTISKVKSDGIGLFRTEFLFISRDTLPSEEEQFNAYKQILSVMGDKPVTIRTLDIGGDKITASNQVLTSKEKNPILGLRGIRYCLCDKELFKAQLRALIRASCYGNLQVMFPMISGVEQFRIARGLVEDVYQDFTKKKIPFKKVPLGITLEVPSAVLMTDILSQFVHFFSIGTNDLIQYTIGVDRGNEHVANLYDKYHPAVLRLIKIAVESSHKHNIKIGVCGQMAGDLMTVILLIGMGIDELSMPPFSVAKVKYIIRSMSMKECKAISDKVLSLNSANAIRTFMKKEIETKFHELF